MQELADMELVRQYAHRKSDEEDLVVVLADMGHPMDLNPPVVNLTLTDLKTGEQREIKDAPMTQENRRAVHESLSLDAR